MAIPYNLAEKCNSEFYNFEVQVSTKFFFHCPFVCKQYYRLTVNKQESYEIVIFTVSFVFVLTLMSKFRGVSRTPLTSKIKLFVTLVNGFQPLTNVTKNSMLDVARFLETPLIVIYNKVFIYQSFITCKTVTLVFCNEINCN